MRTKVLLVLLFVCLTTITVCAQRRKMLVGFTVTDLRAQPQKMNPISYQYDPLQLSQLVFGEYVTVLNSSDGWSYVEAMQQPNYVGGKWGPYLGYIKDSDLVPVTNFPAYTHIVTATVANLFRRSCHINGCLPNDIYLQLSIGTWLAASGEPQFGWQLVRVPTSKGYVDGWILADQLRPLHPVPKGDQLRKALVETSKQMLGWYYFWGGRSSFIADLWNSKTVLTGVDCSGLVGTTYRTQGILLPRDAQPMFVSSANVTNPNDLKPGDLFFYASPEKPNHMFHVMMYIGDNMLVESSTNSTRIMELSSNFGVSTVGGLRWGMKTPGGALVFWGRVIHD